MATQEIAQPTQKEHAVANVRSHVSTIIIQDARWDENITNVSVFNNQEEYARAIRWEYLGAGEVLVITDLEMVAGGTLCYGKDDDYFSDTAIF